MSDAIIELRPEIIIAERERVSILSEGIQGPAGPPGAQGPQGPPGEDGDGGLMAVEDDPAPTLGGDLDLNGFQVRGTINNDEFVLDCGLL